MTFHPWLVHYDNGVPQVIDFPSHPIFHFLEESARKFPNQPCSVFQGSEISYREMDTLTDQMAAALSHLGVSRGDRVGILLPNTPQFILAYFAILKAGAIVVAIDYRFTASEVIQPVNDSGIKFMVLSNERYFDIKKVQTQTCLQTMIVTDLSEHLLSNQATVNSSFDKDFQLTELLLHSKREDRPPLDISAEDIAIFQYTGGTTGTSKAAIATHSNLVINTLQFKNWLPSLQEGREVFLAAIPLFHVYGMVLGMLLGISMGAPLILVRNARDLVDLLENIQEYKPTIFPGVPLLYHALSNHADVLAGRYSLRSLKVCISGSAPLRHETKEAFESLSGGRILEGYGLSEAPTATHCNPHLGINKNGSIGMPLPGVDARVVSLEDGESDVEGGGIGELIISSPQVMKGYHNRPEESNCALRTLGDGKLWLFTGDVVRMDEDGYFFIIDRLKELIKPGGEQVWPKEVEDIIATHPGVSEVSVAGIPDLILGEVVKAWVVVKAGEILTEDEVKDWCKRNLARYKVPRIVEFRTNLPKTTVGKVLRRELVRQQLEIGNTGG